MTSSYRDWLKLAKEMGLKGNPLHTFVKESMEKEEEKIKAEERKELEKQKREDDRRAHEEEIEMEKLRRDDERRAREQEDERQKRQFELQKMEIELRMKQLTGQESNSDNNEAEQRPKSQRDSLSASKYIKMPNFNEEKDNLDAYLARFERSCESYQIQKEQWALILARFLDSKALDEYQKLNSEDAQDYELLKERLLKRFKLTAGGYRKKFKNERLEPGESVFQFVERLKRYLKQWTTMSGYEQTFEGLQELIIRDQFFITCPENLRIFLKEQGKLPLKQMLTKAEAFMDAHENELKRKGWENKDRMQNNEATHKGPGRIHFNEGRQARGNAIPRREERERGDVVCYICSLKGHKAFQCKQKDKSGRHKNFHMAAAVDIVRRRCGDSVDRKTINLMESETTGSRTKGATRSVGKFETPTSVKEIKDLKFKAQVNGIQVQGLRDTGSSCYIIKADLVLPQQMTGRSVNCKLIDSSIKTFQTAFVDIQCPYLEGRVEALIMENPIADLIVGNDLLREDCSFENSTIIAPLQKVIETGAGGEEKDINSTHAEGRRIEETAEGDNYLQQMVNTDGIQSLSACVTRGQMKRETEANYKELKVGKMPSSLNIDAENFKVLQETDETLSRYRTMATENSSNPNTKCTYFIKNGLLYRRCKREKEFDDLVQLVVPKKLRQQIMTIAHNSLLSAHLGVNKTIKKVTSEFHWPDISSEIRRFVLSCDVCQKCINKKHVMRVPMGKMPVIKEPFSAVCVDIIGPLTPMSDRKHRYILTVVDVSTRYPEAIPLHGITSEEVGEALFNIYCRLGIPSRIHTDHGSQFTSKMMEEVNSMLLMKHTMSSPWHAQGNGICERLNGSIKNTLIKLIGEQPREWDRFLGPVMFALRDAIHEAHGFSPFELMFGRSIKSPMRILKQLWTKEESDEEVKNVYEYVVDLRNRIEQTCEIAAAEIEKSQMKNKVRYDKKARERKLEVGDKVLLLLPTSSHKLMVRWKGPYFCVGKVGEYNYKIEVKKGKYKTYHINMLKKYFERDAAEIVKSDDVEEEAFSAAAIAFVHDGDQEEDEELLDLYNGNQTETYKDVKINPALDKQTREEISKLLEEFKDIFSDVPGRTSVVKHEIKLTSSEPVRSKPYPTLFSVQEQIDKELDVMLQNNIIERSEANYAAPLVVVKKPGGKIRLCCNYKNLNKITRFDPEPMMTREQVFNRLAGSTVFSKFDFSSGFYQISMAEDSKDFTTFTCERGLFRFNVLPFGLINSGSSYNRLIRKILHGSKNLESYVDDVLAHTPSQAGHLEILRDFFKRVRSANLTLKPSKCCIGFTEIDFLGHTIEGNGVRPKSESIDKIIDMPIPKTKRQVRSLIGAVNYYRSFIPQCAEILKPLSDLTKNNVANDIKWTNELDKSFILLKESLSKAPILRLPEVSKEFILQTDASNDAIGGVLLQEHDGINHPIAFASRKLLPRERFFAVEEKEALAIIWAVQKFNKYLFGKHFQIETDHCGLQYINTHKVKNARVMRWSLALSNYNFSVKYIKGEDNKIADCLSRIW